MQDILCVNDLIDLLKREIEIYHYDVLDSTSTEARRMITSAMVDTKTDFAVAADSQTSGRGRRGNSFISFEDRGLYFTYVIHGMSDNNEIKDILTTLVAVAVADSLNSLIFEKEKRKAQVKWVNDIYVDDRKVCGILSEALDDRVLIGVGINLYEFEVPAELKDKVGFVSPVGPCKTVLMADIINRIDNLIRTSTRDRIIERVREMSYIIGKRISFAENNVNYVGEAIAIEDDGALKVRLNDGSYKILRSGEVSISFNG